MGKKISNNYFSQECDKNLKLKRLYEYPTDYGYGKR